ncbi:MAG: HPr family phosphocarrier protein [Treponema sp.]|jgi:phosphocarrier protein|nr:HPr family phosphocarrier protein [Treponema sp.]
MTECSYTITNPVGIHARPAGLFIKRLQGFTSIITVIRGGDRCDGKKLLALMKMQVKQGETIVIKAEGEDEEAAAKAAMDFLRSNL